MQIMTNNWVVPAIRIYIIPKDAFPHRYVAIGIYKPADLRVVVSCLEIAEPRFLILNIPTVAERVLGSQRTRQRTGAGNLPAPAIIGVFYYGIVITVNHANTLSVLPFRVKTQNRPLRHPRALTILNLPASHPLNMPSNSSRKRS